MSTLTWLLLTDTSSGFIIALTLNGVGLIFGALDSAIPFKLDCVEVDVEKFAIGGPVML
jgi:hypothetical protein